MSAKKLDQRIEDAVLEIVKQSHPELVQQEGIYQHIENTVEFTEQQLELHHQVAGQIEPNWQHDARNLIHSLKRAGQLISPFPESYGLPRYQKLDEIWHAKRWVDVCESVKNDLKIGKMLFSLEKGNVIVSQVGSGQKKTIRESLVRERVDHLVQCGGRLKVSSFHKWNLLARGIISLHPNLNIRFENGEEFVEIDDDVGLQLDTDYHHIVFHPLPEAKSLTARSQRTVPREKNGGELMVAASGDVKYEWAALNPEHTWADEGELIHIQDCQTQGKGGPQVYCPTCGQKFIATSNGGKIFFRHDGHLGSHRKNEPTWPEDAPEQWGVVSKRWGFPHRGWHFQRIHRTLGFDDVTDIEQKRSEYRANYKAKQSRYRIPVYIHHQPGGNNWQFWAISSSTDDGGPTFSIEGAQDAQSDGNQYWYLIDDISQTTKVDYADGTSEDINWPIGGSNPIILPEAGGAGTLNHERFRYTEAESGHYYRREDRDNRSDVTIGGVKFKRYSRGDFVKYEIALPIIGGSIPWLKEDMIVPLNVANALSDVTRIYPLHDFDSWGIHGEIHLNVDAFVEPLSTRKPAIEMKQTSGSGVSSEKSLISLYPAHHIPDPRAAYVSVDGVQFTPETTCYVEEIPRQISLTLDDGNEYHFTDSKCIVIYSVKDEEQQLYWHGPKEGQVGEILEILRGVDVESFTISITPNSLSLWDWIQITKRLSPSRELMAATGIEIDSIKDESDAEVESVSLRSSGRIEVEPNNPFPQQDLLKISRKAEANKQGRDNRQDDSPSCSICNSPICKRPGMASCKRKAARWRKKIGGST